MLKVLVAPLNWGLGHATRCIPIIKELISQGCTVIIAADGVQKAILQEEFPELSFVALPGFTLEYGKNRAFTLLKIILALPKILIGIKREKAWLRRFARREALDLVISDNRYGLYGAGVFSVFITHQLAIRSSLGAVADWLLQVVNYAFIRQFSLCWVPDREGADNLAGLLSHPRRMPAAAVRYIGWLSRLEPVKTGIQYDLLILLSGPEPQRTILEALVLAQLDTTPGRVILIRGLPTGGPPALSPTGPSVHPPSGTAHPPVTTIYDHLPAGDLARVISQSRLVLARSGYSTVMDLARLGKKAIYIPTPGQPEQEYLGHYLEQKGRGICKQQRDFTLSGAIKSAAALDDPEPATLNEMLIKEIERILDQSAVADLG